MSIESRLLKQAINLAESAKSVNEEKEEALKVMGSELKSIKQALNTIMEYYKEKNLGEVTYRLKNLAPDLVAAVNKVNKIGW